MDISVNVSELSKNQNRRSLALERLKPAMAALALVLGATGGWTELVSPENLASVCVLCVIIVLLEAVCSKKRPAMIIFNCLLFCVATGLCFFMRETVSDGFCQFANRVFEISEEKQLYRYERFIAANSPLALSIFTSTAVSVISAVFSLSCFIDKKAARIVALILSLLSFSAMIYFGVFASIVWQISVCLGLFLFALICIKTDGAGFVSFSILCLAVIIIISAAAGVLYSENTGLRSISEKIRDATAFNVVYETPSPNENPHPLPENESITAKNDGTLSENPGEDGWTLDFLPDFSGSKIGTAMSSFNWVAVFSLIILAILLIPIVKYFIRMASVRRARGKLYDTDTEKAARRIFSRLIEWLDAYGLETSNVPYSRYYEPLSRIISEDYAEKYLAALKIWQGVVYGDQSDEAGDVEKLRDFLDYTKRTILSSSTFAAKIKYRLVRFL